MLLDRSPQKRDRLLFEFADNITAQSGKTLSVLIPEGTIEIHWTCDYVDQSYSISGVAYRGDHQFVREPIYSDGKPLSNPSYELILPPNSSGHLAFRSIEPIEIIFKSY